jgi:hypothetical protein
MAQETVALKHLNIGTRPKAQPWSEHAKLSADDAPPGVYTQNATLEHRRQWWGEMKGQRSDGLEDLRIEMTRSCGKNWTILKVVVFLDGRVRFSANGTAELDGLEYLELQSVINEARLYMQEWGVKDGTRE